jgi:hypothetical protein
MPFFTLAKNGGHQRIHAAAALAVSAAAGRAKRFR